MTNLHLTVEVPGSIFGAGNGRPDYVYFMVLLQLPEQVIRTMKYVDDLLPLAKAEKVLEINRLTEIGRCYGKEMRVGKTEVMKNGKAAIPSTDNDRIKTAGE
jgi:hypothetical protein